jgi:DAK2 domain fusion protein YloV
MGKEIDYAALFGQEEAAAEEEAEEEVPAYIYKGKFTIHLSRKNASKIENSLVEFINSVGDGIVCTLGSDRVKVSVQTNDPGMILQKALSYGDVSGVKIENVMMDGKGDAEEKEETAYTEVASEKMAAGKTPEAEPVKDPVPEEMPHKDVGFITVAVGEGIAEIFRGLGVDFIISGGQTMNPSTDDVLKAIDQVNADTIYILPNNKNIIMAANQAAGLTEDKKIVVIPTKTIPQGITAVINYMPDMDTDANAENMTAEIANVSTAEITYAVRDTMIDDIEIHEGDFMGIGDAGIVYAGKDITETVMETMKKIVTESTEIISIYYGAEVTEEDASALRDQITEAFPDCDVELQSGGQPVYYYILSAE